MFYVQQATALHGAQTHQTVAPASLAASNSALFHATPT
jgi:hypothetical protein